MNISLLNARGKIPIGGILTFIILAGVIYGSIVGYPLFKIHYNLKQIIHEAGNKAVQEQNESVLVKYIVDRAAQKGTTLHSKDIYLRRSKHENKVEIKVNYFLDVDYPLISKTKTHMFTIEYETDLTPLDWKELKEKTTF